MKQLFYQVLAFYMCLGLKSEDTATSIRVTNSSTPRNLDASQIIGTPWTPIKINFTYLYPSQVSAQDQALLDKIFKISATFFTKHLQVRSRNILNPITWVKGYTRWFNLTIPDTIQNMSWYDDFVFLVNVEYNQSDDSVWNVGISQDSTTLRPLMGLMTINMVYVTQPLTDLLSENLVALILHQLVHGLGFLPVLYDQFYDSATGMPYGTSNQYKASDIVYLKTPRLLNLAKQYFNCSNITGIQLEDEGGPLIAGKHFERSLFWKELMTDPSTIANSLVTDFTFQFLQDTGFYRVSEYNPDTLNGWGQNRGCGFIQSYCKGGQFPEFCNGVSNCTFELSASGVCIVDKLSNQCTYQQFQSTSGIDCKDNSLNSLTQAVKNHQHFGYDSICVDTLVNTSLQVNSTINCYQYSCSPQNTLSLMINNVSIDCSVAASAQKLLGTEQSVICPTNPTNVCTQSNDCPNNCNQKGFCTGGVCTCIVGYSGRGCEQTCNQLRRKDQCVSTCPTGTYLIQSISYCIGCPASCASCSNYNLCLTCNQGYDLRGGFCDLNGKPTTVQQTIPNQNNNTTPVSTTPVTTTPVTTTPATNNSAPIPALNYTANNFTDNVTNSTTNSTSSYSTEIQFICLALLSLYFI